MHPPVIYGTIVSSRVLKYFHWFTALYVEKLWSKIYLVATAQVERFSWNQGLLAGGLLLRKAFFKFYLWVLLFFFFFRNVFFVRTIYRAIFIHHMMKKSMKWTLMKWLKRVEKTTWFPWIKSVKNKHSLWACCFDSCFKTTVKDP